MHLKIGTRGSKLAKIQTSQVAKQLENTFLGLTTELVIIKTLGDQIQNVALDKIGDKGVFVKELEQALLDNRIDLAVHSYKDMPTEETAELCFADSPARQDPRDALILRNGFASLDELPQGARIGTGSKRRKYQLLSMRPDLDIRDIRGNIETRIQKIETENLHGIVLAAAGLHRANMTDRITEYLDPYRIVPAPAQGVLALQYRAQNEEVKKILEQIADDNTNIALRAERNFLKYTQGGCHAPVGAFCEVGGSDDIFLTGVFGSQDGTILVKKQIEGHRKDAEKLGQVLAKQIVEEIEKHGR